MPINYALLKGKIVDFQCEHTPKSPHFQVKVLGAENKYFRIAINVKSEESPSELKYLNIDDFTHAYTAQLNSAQIGLQPVASVPNGPAIDYLRSEMFDITQMTLLPMDDPDTHHDLNDLLTSYAQKAQDEQGALIFALGAVWGPDEKPDPYFQFSPGEGIHDIHMNQGNDNGFVKDDGIWQDGAVFFYYPNENRYSAVFLAFQSQATATDDQGHALVPVAVNTEQAG